MLNINLPVVLLFIASMQNRQEPAVLTCPELKNRICAAVQQLLKLRGLLTYYRMCAFAENHKGSKERDNEIYNILILFLSITLIRNIIF